MKCVSFLLLMAHFSLCSIANDTVYTGSTPAHRIVRTFLGIPLPDSVDFIRWKLVISGNAYKLNCQYGIGKPGTDGFINNGNKIELAGKVQKDNNYYLLQSGSKSLRLLELNSALLHVVDTNKQLLNGTGGWSYTLCVDNAATTKQIILTLKKFAIKDSITFHGRTPCRELLKYVNLGQRDCYRLKWSLVLYTNPATGESTTYYLRGTAFEKQGYKSGSWKTIRANGVREIYRLDLDDEGSLYFVRPDENILLFTTPDGKLLVGNKDFSYTLNKKN